MQLQLRPRKCKNDFTCQDLNRDDDDDEIMNLVLRFSKSTGK